MRPLLIDRHGKIYEHKEEYNIISASPHYDIAEKILPKCKKNPLDVLVELGWIVVGSKYHQPYSVIEPTKSQMRTLKKLEIKYVYDFYSRTNESWEIF